MNSIVLYHMGNEHEMIRMEIVEIREHIDDRHRTRTGIVGACFDGTGVCIAGTHAGGK
jgi:hypothetical protein